MLDFGLAKAFDPAATVSGDSLSSPTISLHETQLGLVLGTAAYMAPEQAKGRTVDRRADIWAFGVVVYEMLSGRRLFEGEDVSETLAAVLRQPIDWSALPAATPAALRHLLARCLERDPRKRLRDIGEARIALESSSLSPVGVGGLPELSGTAVEPRRVLWKRVAPLVAIAVFVASIAALAGWKLPLGAYSVPRVSPDGRRLAFTVAAGQEEFIAVYELSGTKAMRRLTLGGQSRSPVWASNGSRVAYQSNREGDVSIFWQPADGSGAAERLTKASPGESHAPESWSPATNTLLFSVSKDGEHTLWALSLPDKTVARFDAVRSTVPINAVFSPDGRWIAYQSDQSGRTTLYVQPVPPTGAVYPFLPRGSDVPHEPVWSPDGKELFYNPRAGGFEVVPITTEPEFFFGNPTALPRPFRLTPPQGRRSYDVAPDGRIAAVILPEGSDESPGTHPLALVLNWHEELKVKVPVPRR